MNATVTLTGLPEMMAILKRFPDEAMRATGAFLYQEGEHIVADAKENFVPVDLGALRDSGYVSLPATSGGRVSVEIGFGGASAEYAVIVHEDLDAQHPNGGQAKYLEVPMLQRTQDLAARLAADVGASLRAKR
jgi:hypothetical protein